MTTKLPHALVKTFLYTALLTCTSLAEVNAQAPASSTVTIHDLVEIPYANPSAADRLALARQQEYASSVIELWSAFKAMESSLAGAGENNRLQSDAAYIAYAEAMQKLNQRFGLSTSPESRSLKKSSGVIVLPKAKASAQQPGKQPSPQATTTATAQPPVALCGGKPAPSSTKKNVTETYTCVCNKWLIASRVESKTFAEPCGAQTVSEGRYEYAEQWITNSQGRFCSAANKSSSYSTYKPVVKEQQSCSSNHNTPHVVPATCVINSETRTVSSEYGNCRKGSSRFQSETRTISTSSSTGILMCALRSWDSHVVGTSSTCKWDCNGNQTDRSCPSSETQVSN